MLKFRHLIVFVISTCFFLQVKGQDSDKNGLWKGFEKVKLAIDGHEAYYVKPVHPLPGIIHGYGALHSLIGTQKLIVYY